MNILCNGGGCVGEICEWGKFRSPSRETLLWERLFQNEGASPNGGALATMEHDINIQIVM